MIERSLYQELIIDHGRRPKNFNRMEDPDFTKFGKNPTCGDHLTIHLCLTEEVVRKISFQGSGCVMSMASASIMTEFIKGKSLSEVKDVSNYFLDLVKGKVVASNRKDLCKLEILSGVKDFPSRVKCVTLAWYTMLDLIKQRKNAILP